MKNVFLQLQMSSAKKRIQCQRFLILATLCSYFVFLLFVGFQQRTRQVSSPVKETKKKVDALMMTTDEYLVSV